MNTPFKIAFWSSFVLYCFWIAFSLHYSKLFLNNHLFQFNVRYLLRELNNVSGFNLTAHFVLIKETSEKPFKKLIRPWNIIYFMWTYFKKRSMGEKVINLCEGVFNFAIWYMKLLCVGNVFHRFIKYICDYFALFSESMILYLL